MCKYKESTPPPPPFFGLWHLLPFGFLYPNVLFICLLPVLYHSVSSVREGIYSGFLSPPLLYLTYLV